MDIKAEGPEFFVWNGQNLAESLENLRKSVEHQGQTAIDWYWNAKRGKSWSSQAIQFMAVVLTALAGLVPIVVQLLKGKLIPDNFDSGPVASLCVGIAAALLGLDRAFGYSSGWTRYVLTATSMTKQLQEFRVDWVAAAAAYSTPTPEQTAAMIQRAKDFVSTIQGSIYRRRRIGRQNSRTTWLK